MPSPTDNGYAFVVLLRDGDDASGLARLLEDVRLPQATVPSAFDAPPVRGLDFFSDEASQASLDKWWAEHVPGDHTPVYLLNHEPGLADCLSGIDGTFYIGLPAPAAASEYPESEQIKTFMSGGPLDFATIIMRDFCGTQLPDGGSQALIFDEGEALRMAALSSDFPIDLDDTAFDFGDPAPAADAPTYTAPTPYSTPPSPFGASQPSFGSAAGAPTSPFGAPAPAAPVSASPFGEPPPPLGDDNYGEAAPANPFDALAGFGPAPQAQPASGAGSGGFGAGSGPPRAATNRKKAAEPATAHPFDLLTHGQDAPKPIAPRTPQPFGGDRPSQAPAPTGSPFDTAAAHDAPGASPPSAPWPAPYPDESAIAAMGAGGGGSWGQPLVDSGSPPRPQSGFSGGGGIPSSRSGGDGARSRASKFALSSLSALSKRGARSNFVETPARELANMIVDRGPTIVVMGSRKGGVGKTSYAAGIAIVAGNVLDAVGHKAAVVDANIANPDAWGQMNLREGAATVREVIAALTANREPPPPVHATTPALAVYPESRETTEYSKTDIKRFADYLRRRFTFIVVDMSNRLPDPMAGPESAAAAYWLEHADVLVLPTTSSKNDFNGVLDYLDVRNLPPTVVPYIIPSVKKNRDHPVTQQYLSVIRNRVHRIVEIPDEADKVRFAGMEGVPVEQVSPTLKAAYRELTEVIVRIPPRARI